METRAAYTFPEERNIDGSNNHKKETESTYIVTTDKQKYHVAIYDYTIDSSNLDNDGVYSICIVHGQDNPDSGFMF